MLRKEKEYIVNSINTKDEELNAFLFSLGCYSGEPITVISRKHGGMVVSIKDGRYNIDSQLSDAIEVWLKISGRYYFVIGDVSRIILYIIVSES